MNQGNFYKSKEQKGKQNLMKLFMLLLIVVIAASFGIATTEFHEEKLMNTYVSVNEVTAELQFTVYSTEEWNEFFGKYKEAYLTREMVYDLLRRLGTDEVILFDEVGKQKPVGRAEWNAVYQQLLDYLDFENSVSVKNILVLSSEDNEGEHLLYTNDGIYNTVLPITYFSEWTGYTVYMLGTECIGVLEKTDTENVISNSYMMGTTEDTLAFLFDGKVYEKKVKLEGETALEGVADITVKDKEIIAIARKQDFIEGHLLSYDDATIEIEGYGRITHSGRLPVYRAYDTVEELSISDIVLGNMDVKYIVGNNEVCAILITAPAEISHVRVLLLAEDGGKFREDIYLQGNGDIAVSCGEISGIVPAGTLINVKDYLNHTDTTLVMTPVSEGTLTYVCNENGKKLSNGYSGKIEVRQYAEGYCLVNEVDFETYLYSVVPSEMPSNYQPEALKAQAVCARSYAYIQVVRSDLAAYGAHINDSSSYQVYNNIAKTEASVKAVDETAGMVMLHEGDVIEAYYFSTSMGYTETEETWNPIDGTEIGYLKPVCLNHQAFEGDLSKEVDFKAYLLTDTTGFDSDIRFYRWEIEADYSELEEQLAVLLESRREASVRHVKFYRGDSETEVERIYKFGDFTSMEVAERSQSGSILKLKVNFEDGYAMVENEYNIRKVLALGASSITYKNGSTGELGSLIPSAFCTVELQEDGTYLLCGGGYGHGIGMSQNGANGLAKVGYNYLDILNFFYKDIEVVDIRL